MRIIRNCGASDLEVWDTSAILADDTLLGRTLHAIAGYSDRPMGIQVGVYIAVLATLAALSGFVGRRASDARATAP